MARVPQQETAPDPVEPPVDVGPDPMGERQGTGQATASRPKKATGKQPRKRAAKSAHAPAGPADGWDALEVKPTEGLTVFRMSNLGGDLSSLVAGALGMEGTPPAYVEQYLQEGRDAENTIIAMFNEEFAKRDATYPELAQLAEDGVIAGYDPNMNEITGTGGPVLWLRVGTTSLVKGHADRIVCINPKNDTHSFAIVEAKKFRPTLWEKWKKNRSTLDVDQLFTNDPMLEKYGWQISAQHYSTGLPVYFVVGKFNPDTAEIEELDTVLFTQSHDGGIGNLPHSLAEIKARVMKAKKHVDAGEVPMCDRHDDSCFYAAFDFCPGKVEKAGEDLEDVELGRLLGLYYAYSVDMAQTDEQKEAKKLRDAVKGEIDKRIAEMGYMRSLSGDPHVYRVWDEAGNEYEYEWAQYDIAARSATSGNKLTVKLVIDTGAVEPEDHPE